MAVGTKDPICLEPILPSSLSEDSGDNDSGEIVWTRTPRRLISDATLRDK
jgi:hypothetical protein